VSIDAVPGEVWMVDFGLVAKQCPVVVLAFPLIAKKGLLRVQAGLFRPCTSRRSVQGLAHLFNALNGRNGLLPGIPGAV
jgi:hypothetical protein